MSHEKWLREVVSPPKIHRLSLNQAADPLPGDDLFLRFFELSLDLFCIANLDGFFLRVNPNFSRVLGYTECELVSQPFLSFIHPEDHEPTAREMKRLRDGFIVASFRNRYRDVRGLYHTLEWTAKAQDQVVYAAARNVSAQVALEEELHANRNRERALLNHTPAVVYVKGVNKHYQFINRQFADLFRVDQENVVGRSDFEIFPPEVARRFAEVDDQVIRSRAAITAEEQAPHDDGLHTYISVKFPLFDARGQVQGVAGISTDISDRLRAQAAEQELQLARVFQRTLYPEEPPKFAGLDIAGAAFPVSHVCGDYFDYIPLSDSQLAIALGDVAGHGYKPALQMVELRSTLRLLLQMVDAPQAAVEKLNKVLCADFVEVPSFVSFFLAQFDVLQRTLRYIGAGHDAFLIRANGAVEPLDSTSMVLGVIPDESYPEATPLTWNAGDTLIVFTDGFNEAENDAGEQFGKQRVIEAVLQQRDQSARVMIDQLFAALVAFVGDATRKDDMTVVAVKAVA